jgi:hypothetical protein
VIKREASPRTCSHAVFVVTALADAIDLDGAQPSPAYDRNGKLHSASFHSRRPCPAVHDRKAFLSMRCSSRKLSPMAKAVKAGNSSTAEQEITLLLIARGRDCFKRFYVLPRHVVSQGR